MIRNIVLVAKGCADARVIRILLARIKKGVIGLCLHFFFRHLAMQNARVNIQRSRACDYVSSETVPCDQVLCAGDLCGR